MKVDISDVLNGLDKIENRADVAVRVFAEQGALKMQNYAKKKAPWTDRTGDARRRLKGSVGSLFQGYRIFISHGVYYGIFLELCNERRFSILPQTIHNVGTLEILPAFKNFMEKL